MRKVLGFSIVKLTLIVAIISLLIGHGAGIALPKAKPTQPGIAEIQPSPKPATNDQTESESATLLQGAMLALGIALIPIAWPALTRNQAEIRRGTRRLIEAWRAVRQLRQGWIERIPDRSAKDIDIGGSRYVASAQGIAEAIATNDAFTIIGWSGKAGQISRADALGHISCCQPFLALATADHSGAILLVNSSWKSDHVEAIIVGSSVSLLHAHALAAEFGLTIIA